jgi:type VI protein secretion system component VasA
VSVSISPQLSAALEQNADGKLDPFLERLLSRFLAREAGIQDALKGFLSSARAPA